MKATRLLTSVLCFLLIINFFRTINGVGVLGSSDVLERLDEFELDLAPVYNLVDLWKKNDYGAFPEDDMSTDDEPSSDAGVVPLVDSPGGGSFGNGGFEESEDDSVIERLVKRLGNILSSGWESVLNFLEGLPVIGTLVDSVFKKIHLISNTIAYLWNNAFSLLMLPIHLLSQTLSFSFWIRGFGN